MARRVDGFSYAIRNVVFGGAARRGRRRPRPLPEYRRPQRLRFQDAATPDRRRRTRHARRPQRLRPVAGHRAGARSRRGRVDRQGLPGLGRPRAHHRGHVRSHRSGAELARRQRQRSARPDADVPAVHGAARENRRAREVLPRRSGARLAAGSRSPRKRWSPRHTRVLVVIDPNNPTGATYPGRHPPRAARFRRPPWPGRSWPTRCTAISATTARSTRSASSIRMPRSSRSRACRRRTWRRAGEPAGWRSVARRGSTMSLAAIKKMSDARLCSTVPMQYAVRRRCWATGRTSRCSAPRCAARADVTAARCRHAGHDAAFAPAGFYAMPKVDLPPGQTDQDFVLGLLRARASCASTGRASACRRRTGFFRIVFLASPEELDEILRRLGRTSPRGFARIRRRPTRAAGMRRRSARLPDDRARRRSRRRASTARSASSTTSSRRRATFDGRDGRQPLVEQLPRPDDASAAARARARGDPAARRRLRLGPHDRRHDGDPHGARAPARGVQADRGGRRLPERLHRQRRHGLRRSSRKDDVVISDELNHASIIDGCRLSRATIKVFPHKDVDAARSILRTLPAAPAQAAHHRRRVQHGRRPRPAAGAVRAGRGVRLHHDGGRCARERRVRAERARHRSTTSACTAASTSRSARCRRRSARWAGTSPAAARSSTSSTTARGRSCSRRRIRRRSPPRASRRSTCCSRSRRSSTGSGTTRGSSRPGLPALGFNTGLEREPDHAGHRRRRRAGDEAVRSAVRGGRVRAGHRVSHGAAATRRACARS